MNKTIEELTVESLRRVTAELAKTQKLLSEHPHLRWTQENLQLLETCAISVMGSVKARMAMTQLVNEPELPLC